MQFFDLLKIILEKGGPHLKRLLTEDLGTYDTIKVVMDLAIDVTLATPTTVDDEIARLLMVVKDSGLVEYVIGLIERNNQQPLTVANVEIPTHKTAEGYAAPAITPEQIIQLVIALSVLWQLIKEIRNK